MTRAQPYDAAEQACVLRFKLDLCSSGGGDSKFICFAPRSLTPSMIRLLQPTIRFATLLSSSLKPSITSARFAACQYRFSNQAFFDDEASEMGKEKFVLKTPKGTKDCMNLAPFNVVAITQFVLGQGKDMVLRDRIFSTITQVFKRHGAVTIDT